MLESMKYCRVAVALLACGLLHAGDAGWSLGATGNVVTDSVFGIAKTFGATVDGAYTWNSEAAGLPLRATLGYSNFPASGNLSIAGTGASHYKIGLQNFQVGLDGFATLPSKTLKLFFGFTLNKWLVNSDSSYFVADDSVAGGHLQRGSLRGSVPGIKLGFHIGLEQPVSEHLSGVAEFQASALGTSSVFMVPADPSWAAHSGNTGVNPCWLQLGVRYHF